MYTGAVAFVAVLGVLTGEQQGVVALCGSLILTIGGGILVGGLAGWGSIVLSGRTSDHLVEITFTTLAAYGSFYVAERYHLSGVLAAMTAGLAVGNYSTQTTLSDRGRHALETFWEYVAFIANSLIFLLIGAQEDDNPTAAQAEAHTE